MRETSRGTVLVTGAAGFIGRHCVRHLAREGFVVRALVRNPQEAADVLAGTGASVYRCELPDDIDTAAFKGPVRALVHCAYATRYKSPEEAERTNIIGMRRLIDHCEEADVGQIVFISTVQARADSLSYYGKSKYLAEQLLTLERDLVLRPGMVIGDGGVFERLRMTIRHSRILPLFYGGRQSVQTIWIYDLVDAIATGIGTGARGVRHLAEPTPVPIREFYRRVAAIEGVHPLFVPLPGSPVLKLLRVGESFGLVFPISSENLLGLKQLRSIDVAEDLRALGITVRPFEESLVALTQLSPD